MNLKGIMGGDRRSSLIKKNIAVSLLVKGWSCIVQFLLVPLSLQCLTKYEYGIWLTINSILVGIDAIDVGLGNGLRNRLAEAMATGNREMARRQVSTTFIMLILVMVPLVLLLSVILMFVDCNKLMNVDPCMVHDMRGVLIASIAIMGATFVFKFIGNMYMGLQLPAINNILVVLGQTVSLVILYVISLFGKSSLMTVAIAFTVAPLAVYLLAYPISFCGRYKFLAPSLKSFDKESLRILFSLGVKFFVIQISGLMLFMSSNVIISHVLTPAEVTPYQIAYRYFSILSMLFAIIASPLWSATTDAYTIGDWKWINRMMHKMNYLLVFCFFVSVAMLAFASTFYHIWVGNKVTVQFFLSALMAIYAFGLVVSNCYSNILFGIGKIRLMMRMAVIEVIAFIPIQFYACSEYGVEGLLCILIFVTAITAFINYIQFKKISTQTAKGIWNK